MLTSARDGLQKTVLELTAMLARSGAQLQDFLEHIGDGNGYNGVTITRCAND